MKLISTLILFYSPALLLNAQQINADDIVGEWLDHTQNKVIQLTRAENHYIGHITWLKSPLDENGEARRDPHNPKKSLRDREILGLQILSGLEFVEGKWIKGQIYSPERGGTINCEFTLLSENALQIKISKLFFSTTQLWTRQ